tara:strand:- start:4004 stop:4351 length:348 start_codon:yes stop_codon:yes gene_type:complete
MKKVYHLEKCSTCKRILKELNWDEETQEIRAEKITEKQLDEMAALASSYEALFSRRAIKYKTLKLKEKILSEADYKQLILEYDTFLKRPVFLIDGAIFIGNTKKTVEAVQAALHE